MENGRIPSGTGILIRYMVVSTKYTTKCLPGLGQTYV
jgi:hypothetical protein